MDPRSMVCRQDCEFIERARIAALLEHANLSFIATSAGDQHFLNPDIFRYDRSGKQIYFYTAIEGHTRKNIENNPRACFGLGEIGRRPPADSALEWPGEHQSVIVFGNHQLVESGPERRGALQCLLANDLPELKSDVDSWDIAVEELERTSVSAREIESWSAEEKSAAL